MKICERCSGRLDSAAKCALSPVCTNCASIAGEVEPVDILRLVVLTSRRDWERLMDRLH